MRRILAEVKALDHQVCLSNLYSCELRLGGLRLQVRDIDAEPMLLQDRNGECSRLCQLKDLFPLHARA